MPASPATAVYVRISRDADLTRLGVKRQRADCEKLCAANDWSPVVFYEDNDTSAFSGKRRPAYEQMLDEMKAGSVERVVAWHPDRLHRSLLELERFIEVVDATACSVVTVTSGHYDLSTPEGRMTARIIGSVARAESEHKSRRVARKLDELAEAGAFHGGGTRPFGYRRVPGPDGKLTIVVDEAEAAVVREMVARFIAGESLYALARELEARGVPTVRGGKWTRSGTLLGILTNPLLSAQRVHNGQVVAAGTWPAIVTREQTANARAVAVFLRATPKRTSPAHLLNGLVVCGGCGGPLYAGESRNGKPRLRCRAASGCVTITRAPVVDVVVDAVLKVFDDADLAAHAPRPVDAARRAVDDIRDAEAQLSELAGAYADRVISMGEWKLARARIEARLDQAKAAAGGAVTTDTALLPFRGKPGALRKAWPALPDSQRRAVLGAVIDRVLIAPGLRGPRNLHDRITITWRA